jgi:hypothetical protein
MSCAFNARAAARSVLVVGLFASLFIALAIDTTLAQGPFGMGAAAPHPPGGVAGWVLAKQAEYYRALGTMIRAGKADGSAAVGLLGLNTFMQSLAVIRMDRSPKRWPEPADGRAGYRRSLRWGCGRARAASWS